MAQVEITIKKLESSTSSRLGVAGDGEFHRVLIGSLSDVLHFLYIDNNVNLEIGNIKLLDNPIIDVQFHSRYDRVEHDVQTEMLISALMNKFKIEKKEIQKSGEFIVIKSLEPLSPNFAEGRKGSSYKTKDGVIFCENMQLCKIVKNLRFLHKVLIQVNKNDSTINDIKICLKIPLDIISDQNQLVSYFIDEGINAEIQRINYVETHLSNY